jgi:hypothetical protein
MNIEDDTKYDSNVAITILHFVDEILDLDIPANTIGCDVMVSGKQLYECEECESVLKTRSGLVMHNRRKHEGVAYPCKQCEYQTADKSSLRRHQKSKHKDIVYSCNKCEYHAAVKSTLRGHQQSKHEGVRFRS